MKNRKYYKNIWADFNKKKKNESGLVIQKKPAAERSPYH